MAANIDGLVLGTVNAPSKRSLDAVQLARAVVANQTNEYLPQLATFFSEVSPGLVLGFAEQHGISRQDLAQTYAAVKVLTGERNERLERLLGGLA